MTWRIYTQWTPMWRDFAVAIERDVRGEGTFLVTEFRMSPLDQSTPMDAGWELFRSRGEDGGRQFLQAALDAAWAAGLRPSQGVEEAGALTATRAHLADMQRLVFDRMVK